MIDNFWATLAGATVAGGIGLATLLTQQYLADRRRLNEDILAPAFNYVAALPEECPWVGLPDPPWSALDPYHWRSTPAKFRRPLGEMSKRIAAYRDSYGHYWEFMGTTGATSFVESVRTALSKYVSADGSAVSARSIGMNSIASIQIGFIASGVVPYISMNPGDPNRAWDQLEKVGPDVLYWAKASARALRESDPTTLQGIFESVSKNPNAAEARQLSGSLRESYRKVVEGARVVEGLLARRLRLGKGQDRPP